MTTAPEFFDHTALLEPTGHRYAARVFRLGFVGAGFALVNLVLIAAAESRVSHDAFARVLGWF